MCMYESVRMQSCVSRYLHRSEEGINSPGAGITGGSELPDVGTRNQTLVLWKSSK